MLDSRKNRLNRIEVPLCNRVELVVVAASAAEGQSQKGGSGRVDQIRQLVLALHECQVDVRALYKIVGAGNEKAGADWFVQCIARNLFAHELVVWLVFVQSTNDPIPIGPGIGTLTVGLKSLRFPKADQVQPVPSPTFAISRAVQYLVNQILPRRRRVIVDEPVNLLRRWGHAVHHQVQTPDPCTPIGPRRGGKLCLGQPFENKRVNRVGNRGSLVFAGGSISAMG